MRNQENPLLISLEYFKRKQIRPILKSKVLLTSVKNSCPQLTWKLNEAILLKILIESKQIKTDENQWLFLSYM